MNPLRALKAFTIVAMFLTVSFGTLGQATAGEIMLPVISVEPGSYDFGPVPLFALASGYIRVINSGDMPLVVNAVKTKAPFLDGATSFTVPGHSSRRVLIGFAPTVLGPASGVCTIQSNANNAPVLNVPLSGEGVE
jgi:hypothetical protein